MSLSVIKELPIEPAKYNFKYLLDYIDNAEFSKVKTKYSKGDDWTAISFRGYGPDPLDILKPNVLKSGVDTGAKLQYTSLSENTWFTIINRALEKIPSTFERVRFMKIKANSSIGKHSDKIDKDFGLEDGNIVGGAHSHLIEMSIPGGTAVVALINSPIILIDFQADSIIYIPFT